MGRLQPLRVPFSILRIFLLFCLAGNSRAPAQTYSFGQGYLAAGTLPMSVATADLNGDGNLDLVVANLNDSTVSVFLGKPDGTFSLKVDYPTGPQPSSVIAADFNGDGNLDLAVANEDCVIIPHISSFGCGAGSISILLGKGDGTFQPHQDFPTAVRPLAVQAADMNGDGKLDLVVASNLGIGNIAMSNNSISILLGNGDGTFQNHVDYATPSGEVNGAGIPAWVVVADFNGDGKLDVAANYALPETATGTFPGAVAVYLGNTDGTLQRPVIFQVQDQFGPACSAATGDFNGDGRQDLSVTTNSGIEIFLGNGDGTFTLKGSGGGGFGQIIAVDLDKDGKLDLVATSPLGNGVTAILGNGDGTFQMDTEFNIATGSWPSGIAVGDFNGDGEQDIAVTVINISPPYPGVTSPAGSVVVFLGEGNGVFGGTPLSSAVGADKSVTVSIKAVDLNGDGKLDLVFVNSGQPGSSIDNTVSVLLGRGDGTFRPQQTFPTGLFPVDVEVADFNGDGKPDLAVANQICALTASSCGAGSVSVLLGKGDGTFQPHVDFAVGVTPASLATGDFSGNGKPGIAVANNGLGQGNSVSILTGKGDGTFNAHVDYTLPGPPTAVATGDFNHDGKIDVAVSTLSANPQAPIFLSPFVSTLLGKGDGTFQQPVETAVATGVFGPGYLLVPTDFNGDGNLDLIGGHIDTGALSLFYGKGDGLFQDLGNIGSGVANFVNTGLFAVGDFDGDGNVDVALVDTSDKVVVFRGNGQGAFQPAQEFLAPTAFDLGNRIIASGDFNGDGLLDFAVVKSSSGAAAGMVSVFLNDPFKGVFPTSLAFGSQGVGTSSAVQTVTIGNPSAAPFTISNIAVSGAYAETNSCATKLSRGESCAINVRFVPTIPGVSNGSITLTDSTHSSPQTIPLTGSGVDGAFLRLSPTHLSMASTEVGGTSAPQAVTLTNTGNATLAIASIGIAGGNAGDFAETNTCGSALAPGGACSVSVTFMPTAGGTRVSALTITDSAPGNPHKVNLSGISVSPLVTLSAASLTFSAQVAGTTSAPQNVTLSNTGTAALNITQVFASGDFAETNTCGASLAIGASCQITVTFTPTTGSSRSGILTITDNVSGNPETITLTGMGQDFTVVPSGAATATVTPGQTATFVISLAPGGGLSPTVMLTCGGTPTGATCSISPATVTLSGTTASTATVTVTTKATSLALLPGATEKLKRIKLMLLLVYILTLLALGSLYRLRAKQPFGWASLLATTLLLWVGMTLTSCGGGGSGGGGSGVTGTQTGTYTITVSASAAAGSTTLTHSTKLTLIVQ
jgi:hypothetical protein